LNAVPCQHEDNGTQVQVVLIGRKRGNSVVIDGKRFVL
jgi:hypothetical protein